MREAALNRQTQRRIGHGQQLVEPAFGSFLISSRQVRSRKPKFTNGSRHDRKASGKKAFDGRPTAAEGKEHQTTRVAQGGRNEFCNLWPVKVVEFYHAADIAGFSFCPKQEMEELWFPPDNLLILRQPC